MGTEKEGIVEFIKSIPKTDSDGYYRHSIDLLTVGVEFEYDLEYNDTESILLFLQEFDNYKKYACDEFLSEGLIKRELKKILFSETYLLDDDCLMEVFSKSDRGSISERNFKDKLQLVALDFYPNEHRIFSKFDFSIAPGRTNELLVARFNIDGFITGVSNES